MDQFRGLTVLLMFAVHYAGNFALGVNLAPVFRHNNYYLSVGDLAFPWFHFAVGFALRLTLLRRIRTHGAPTAYRRAVHRCLLLIVLGDAFPLLGGLRISRWGVQQRSDFPALLATYLKVDFWTILAVLGVTSLWVLPVIGRSARLRVAFLLGGLSLHALAMQMFYLDFMKGRPNPVDAMLGTTGVLGHEGGPLGFLVWAVPQIAGSLVYDRVTRERPRRSCRRLLAWGAWLIGIGYGLSCLSTFYPLAQGPRASASDYPATEQSLESPVLPGLGNGSSGDVYPGLADLPFIPPPPPRQRIWNYWMASRHLATPTFMLMATGFGILTYFVFVLLSEAGTFRVGILRTLGQNPLIAYFLDPVIGGLVSVCWPTEGGWPWTLAGAAVRLALTYLPLRVLEWRRIYLRL
jgi:predicted acyltransferase